MVTQHDQVREVVIPPPRPPRAAWRKGLEKALLIVGGTALLVGLIITFAGDHHTLGIGVWWWETGEITTPWEYGFLIGGAVLIIVALASIIGRRRG